MKMVKLLSCQNKIIQRNLQFTCFFKKFYLMHKFQVYQDKFHWSKILVTASAREIYHIWILQKSVTNVQISAAIKPL